MTETAFPSIVQLYPEIKPLTPSPEQVRAQQDGYEPDRGWGAFSAEVATEGGPDKSVYVVGARFEGIVTANGQGDDERHGYFITQGTVPLWDWVMWLCSWDDEYGQWTWCPVAAVSADCSQVAAARELLREFWVHWSEHQGMVTPEGADATGVLARDIVDQVITDVFVDDDAADAADAADATDE